MSNVHIRWMIRRDMDRVLEIECSCFGDPWTEHDFLLCLRKRNCIGMVAERNDEIVGLMIYELHKYRLHVLNFAVHPDHQRSGVGSAMASKLADKIENNKHRTFIQMEVRDRNLPAQLFFKAMGFRATEVLPLFYQDAGEDAYRMIWGEQKGSCVVEPDRNRPTVGGGDDDELESWQEDPEAWKRKGHDQ